MTRPRAPIGRPSLTRPLHFDRMAPDFAIIAARNNAVWCDIVCRAHDAPGEFRDHAWCTKRFTPPYYPNLVTLTRDDEHKHLGLVDEILEATRAEHEIGVKDSFANMDLAS